MTVTLIGYTQLPGSGSNPLSIVEYAAARCYDRQPTAKHHIAKGCAKDGHLSVYEHLSFTFHVSGISRACLAQLTRHRHLSFSVRSQRYCDEGGFTYVNPYQGKSDTMGARWFDELMEQAQDAYTELRGELPAEDARMVLPNACCTELVVTGNARAWIESSGLRLCARAQREIRDLYIGIQTAIRPVCPEVADLMRPQCERDPAHPFCVEVRRTTPCRHPKLAEVYVGGDDGR